ncbi:MAG TPA: N-acetylmuramoyl-L-alanine amidase [Acidimicrobiales bacterium]
MVLIVACLVVIVGALSGHLGSGLFGSRANGPQAISPSTMATGACVALPPTSGDNHRTIFLDAGHGGVDPGGVGTTESGQQVDESTVNLAIELDTSDLLRAQGYRVVVSRTADTTVVRLTPADLSDGVLSATGVHADVAARDICANFAKADALVGIYMDSSTSSADAGSVTVYDTARPFAAANQRPAQIVQTDVLSAMNSRGWQIPDDGAFPDAGYGSSVGGDSGSTLADLAASYNHLLLIGPPLAGYFSTPSLMPGAVIEPLYLTDPFEGSIAATPGDQQVIAKGIAAAVEQFLAPVQSTPTS